ncbi:aldose 1-epimerase family protein [Eubacteriales bacterium OttesenSCG-928-N13]|nr:aldose 1-epimerase family protein [Eubacteriales bacterium OttesenSCG-928-N13]
MKRSGEHELRKYVGDLSALYGIKRYTMTDGRDNGVRAMDLDNGQGLTMTVLQERGLDIPFLRFKGVNVGFYSKTGISHPAYYQEDGARGFLKQFYAGLLTTCGVTYAGAACEDDGRKLGLHGPFSNTPAEMVNADIRYDGDDAVLHVQGQVREACVFEENMRLTRSIDLETEKNILHLTDTVENLGFADSPSMMVYHINFGYPMLDEGAKLYFSAKDVKARDEIAQQGLDAHDVMEKPTIERPEQCYFHTNEKDPEHAFAMLHNEKLGMAAIVHFDARELPLLCEWKCMRAGDYALGLEPTAAGVMGRAAVKQDGMLPIIKPGESKTYCIALEMTDDQAIIDQYIAKSGK